MEDRSRSTTGDPDPGEMLRCGLGLLACYTALIVAKARQSVDIDALLIKLQLDLDFVAGHCPEVREAKRIIAGQLGGDGDRIDPSRAAGKIEVFQRRLTRLFRAD